MSWVEYRMTDTKEHLGVENYISQRITVMGSVGVNRSYGGIFLEVGGALLYDFLSSNLPNCY
jgi:hypothetical protein